MLTSGRAEGERLPEADGDKIHVLELLKAVPGAKAVARTVRRVGKIHRHYRLYEWETGVPTETKDRLEQSGLEISVANDDDMDRLGKGRPSAV